MSNGFRTGDTKLSELAESFHVEEAALRDLLALTRRPQTKRRVHWRWVLLTGIAASSLTLGIGHAIGAADPPSASEVVPRQIPYRGILEQNGDPVTATDLPMTFELFDASGAGAPIWSETKTAVAVTDGKFNVDLGNCTAPESSCPLGALEPILARKPPALYIGVTVNGVALQGRQRLLSVPYAERATWSSTADRATLSTAAQRGEPGQPFVVDGPLGVGLAATQSPSAALQVDSTSRGILLPRVTTAQRLAIPTPAAGLLVYDTTAQLHMQYAGSRWAEVGAPPLGTIVAWHKSLTGTPALAWGWAECNGQSVSDGESPYNGVTLPNLNGEARFLRGGASSGVAQAATEILGDTHYSHQLSIRNEDSTTADESITFSAVSDTYPYVTRWYRVRPINMTVIWIIRVK